MTITINDLRRDTYHFICKQIGTILFISIISTLIGILTDIFIRSDMHIISIIENKQFHNNISLLDLIDSMNISEKKELLKYSMLKIIEILMNKTLLLGSIITCILTVSNNLKKPIMTSMYSLFSFLPNLFILNFITMFITQIGFLLFIVPGIVLSILLSLSPIILSIKKYNIIDSIRLSVYISWKNIKIIGPGVIFWISGKLLLITLFSNIHFLNNNLMFLILHVGVNVLFCILIVYLFRFYMLFTHYSK